MERERQMAGRGPKPVAFGNRSDSCRGTSWAVTSVICLSCEGPSFSKWIAGSYYSPLSLNPRVCPQTSHRALQFFLPSGLASEPGARVHSGAGAEGRGAGKGTGGLGDGDLSQAETPVCSGCPPRPEPLARRGVRTTALQLGTPGHLVGRAQEPPTHT